MPTNEAPSFSWTFTQKVEPTAEILQVLLEDERVHVAYKTVRDVAVITDKRIVIADKQGLTGKKIEIYSIPFKSVVMFSSENAGGMLDVNAEIEIWTRVGRIKLKLNKGVDIRELDRIIARAVL